MTTVTVLSDCEHPSVLRLRPAPPTATPLPATGAPVALSWAALAVLAVACAAGLRITSARRA